MALDTNRVLEIAAGNLAAGDQEIGGPPGLDIERILRIAELAPIGGSITKEKKKIGIIGAFKAGVGSGILDPFRIVGVTAEEVELDETSESVANFLGFMVGLGVSFIPFAFGTGLALKGIGLTARISRTIKAADGVTDVINPLYYFTRNTIAGATQFAGGAKELEDVPLRIAGGVAFGAAIEGIFLARAMKGRRGAIGKEHLVPDGNPVPDVPVDVSRQVLESEIAPAAAKSSSRQTVELHGLLDEDKIYDEVLVDLIQEHIETARLTGLDAAGVKKIRDYTLEKYPTAQVLSRSGQVKEVKEMLIHSPFDPADRLTPKQIQQWKATGFAEGEQVFYRRDTWAATGKPVAPGFVQLSNPLLSEHSVKRIVFAAPIEEVTRPTNTRFFRKSATRTGRLKQAVEDMGERIGFVVPASTVAKGASLSARRGFVDVSEYQTISNFDDFAKPYMADLASVQGAGTKEEAVAILAGRQGIKGVRIVDEGVTTRVIPFDQKTVSFITEPPRIALSSSELRPIGGPRLSQPQINLSKSRLEGALSIAPTEVETLKIFTMSSERGLTHAILTRNTKPGEKPFRLSFIGENVDGSLEVVYHNQYDSVDDAVAFISKRNTEILGEVGHVDSLPGGFIEQTLSLRTKPTDIPNIGLTLDDAVFSTSLSGEPQLASFTPSWRNSISAPLREAGIPEKEIAQYLDMYAANVNRRLDSLMDPEFQGIKNASTLKFGGCP